MNSGIVIWYNWCDWCRKPIGHQLGFQGCSPTVKRSQNNRVHDFSVFLADHKNNHPTSSVSSPLRRLWSEGKWKKNHEKHRCFRKKKNLKLPTSKQHIFQPARYHQSTSPRYKCHRAGAWCACAPADPGDPFYGDRILYPMAPLTLELLLGKNNGFFLGIYWFTVG